MAATALIEYLGFRPGEDAREYRLRVRRGDDSWGLTVAIPNEAFLSGRVRYQDAPDICYLKVRSELAATGEDGVLERDHRMTDEELEEYKVSHTPKNPHRRS
ncbi:MAG: hypothetical protein LJF30_08280 [Acidobacteria bacterium]|jgi:hypothetical protein|nr:hypothetical protein [Acidobacteriota bacterium]